MNKIYINHKPVLPTRNFGQKLLSDICWFQDGFNTHEEIIKTLKGKKIYTVTILIKNLKWELRRKKEFVKYSKIPIGTLYHELLFKKFYKEYESNNANEIYRKWLDKYKLIWTKSKFISIDDYILFKELEPRYKTQILSGRKNIEKLTKSRYELKRERHYNLPEPLNRVDWRNSFDNIFIWSENGQKYARRGGSGSSGARETNSIFIYGLLALNKIQPIPSYLFMYSEENKLLFIKNFPSFTIPSYDIGTNYSVDNSLDKKLRQNGHFIKWDDFLTFNHISIN